MARHRTRETTALGRRKAVDNGTARFSWRLAPALSLLVASPAVIHGVVDFAHPNDTVTKIAFGSCHNSKHALKKAAKTATKEEETSATAVSENVWQRIAHENASVWLWTGDAIYPPKKGIASVDLLRDEYQKMKENALIGYGDYIQHSSVKPSPFIYGTWDDHDYGGNDLGKDMPDKEARADAFFEFLNLTRPKQDETGKHRPGVYSSVSFGKAPNQVHVILLDTRWHREDHCVPSVASKIPILGAGIACVTRWLSAGLVPNLCGGGGGGNGNGDHGHGTSSSTLPPPSRLLGDAQWKWLEQELEQSTAAIHVIVSSIQVLTTNPVSERTGALI
jgi:alkaline phosphatase D